MCGKNLSQVGHRRYRNTAGYAHLADGHLVEATEEIGRIIATAMTLRSPVCHVTDTLGVTTGYLSYAPLPRCLCG